MDKIGLSLDFGLSFKSLKTHLCSDQCLYACSEKSVHKRGNTDIGGASRLEIAFVWRKNNVVTMFRTL